MSEQDETLPEKPCRHCGTETTQRAEGIPYCGMDCIKARRREKRMKTFRCPYPNCGWETEYDPENAFSKAVFDADARKHRQEEHPGGGV